MNVRAEITSSQDSADFIHEGFYPVCVQVGVHNSFPASNDWASEFTKKNLWEEPTNYTAQTPRQPTQSAHSESRKMQISDAFVFLVLVSLGLVLLVSSLRSWRNRTSAPSHLTTRRRRYWEPSPFQRPLMPVHSGSQSDSSAISPSPSATHCILTLLPPVSPSPVPSTKLPSTLIDYGSQRSVSRVSPLPAEKVQARGIQTFQYTLPTFQWCAECGEDTQDGEGHQ